MAEILVLGGGMVGSAMASDMSVIHSVTVADSNNEVLSRLSERFRSLKTLQLDVNDKIKLAKTIKGFDLVINAVPGSLGFATLRTIIETGRDVVDIAFFPEDGLTLHELAVKNGVTAIIDCGVAPGMSNIILGYYNKVLTLTDFECLVGGLPRVREWPFCYKAPFSPVDVIEEYTRTARYIENGKLVEREPLSDCELVNFGRVGTLESFNSDGLRSILFTMPHIPNMKEKTLRYPGHVEYIRVLKKSGFFEKEAVTINGHEIVPLDFTSKILFKEWKLGEEEDEFTVMRVSMKGVNKGGRREEVIYNLYDEYCRETKTSSMARTTGYTATAAANMVLDGLFNRKGVFPPELIGGEEVCFRYIIEYLEKRNVCYEVACNQPEES